MKQAPIGLGIVQNPNKITIPVPKNLISRLNLSGQGGWLLGREDTHRFINSQS